MDHERFEWDFENLKHIADHDVTPEEAEAVLSGVTKFVGAREAAGEVRYSEMGLTATGRLLLVAWTERGKRMRVVTAFGPSATLKRRFYGSDDRQEI